MTGVSSDRCCHFSEAAGFTEIAGSQETVLASVFCFVLLWFRSLSSVISFVFTHWLGLGKGCGAEIWRVANESRIPAQEYICNPLGVRCSASWTRLRCNCVFLQKPIFNTPKMKADRYCSIIYLFRKKDKRGTEWQTALHWYCFTWHHLRLHQAMWLFCLCRFPILICYGLNEK